MRQAGFTRPVHTTVDEGRVAVRDIDEIVAAVFSLSGSAPHQFGDQLGAFETRLRELLWEASPSGRFAERFGPIEVVIRRR